MEANEQEKHHHDFAKSRVYTDSSTATRIGMTQAATVAVCLKCEAYKLDGRVYVPESEKASLQAQLAEAQRERDGWRRLAVEHGAEVQADNEYLLKRHEPLQAENSNLQRIIDHSSDEIVALKQRAEAAESQLTAMTEKAELADEMAEWIRTRREDEKLAPDADWLARYDALADR